MKLIKHYKNSFIINRILYGICFLKTDNYYKIVNNILEFLNYDLIGILFYTIEFKVKKRASN